MKKVLKTGLLLSLFALFTASCVEEHYTNTDVWTFFQEYEVGTRNSKLQWSYDEIDDLFFCTVYIDKLTNQVYREGILAGYFVDFIDGRKVNSPLPYSQFFVDKGGYQWSYQYTCEFSPGRVTFIFRDSDYAVDTPPGCTFLVKMMR